MSRRLRRALVALPSASAIALLWLGCSPTLATPSSHSADPSSPSAPAGRSPLEAVPTAPAAAASAEQPADHAGHGAGHDRSGHAHHDHGSPPPAQGSAAPAATPKNAAAVYACPMHPEVRGNGPSLCPKCNMKLEKLP